MATMNVSLPDQMKAWVEEQTKDGTYANVSDHIRDLIRKDKQDREALAELKRLYQEGIDSGPAEPFDFEVFREEMEAKYGGKYRG